MKNQFQLLKEAVQQHNDHVMNAIIELLENYNNGLSSYFSKREISREFLDTFDINLTLNEIKKRFDVNDRNQIVFSTLISDLNLLARNTWYFKTDDGRILTGEDLYQRKAVYWASHKEIQKVYATPENQSADEERDDYIESVAFWGDENASPQPVGTKEVNVDVPGYEKPETVDSMVSLINFYSMTLGKFLKK